MSSRSLYSGGLGRGHDSHGVMPKLRRSINGAMLPRNHWSWALSGGCLLFDNVVHQIWIPMENGLVLLCSWCCRGFQWTSCIWNFFHGRSWRLEFMALDLYIRGNLLLQVYQTFPASNVVIGNCHCCGSHCSILPRTRLSWNGHVSHRRWTRLRGLETKIPESAWARR